MADFSQPSLLADALTELIAQRGYARMQGNQELVAAWKEVAPEWAPLTRPLKVMKGVLQVTVTNPVVLSELVSFHRLRLVAALQEKHPKLKLRDIKFRLQT